MKKLVQRIRNWFDWSDLFSNEYDWTQESYEGNYGGYIEHESQIHQ